MARHKLANVGAVPAAQVATQPQPIAVAVGQLGQGGTERQLYMFLSYCDRTLWAPVVYVSGGLSGPLGFWEPAIRGLGVAVVPLRGSQLAKMWQLRSACISQRARCFFSWSSYTNAFAMALTGLDVHCIGSFRAEIFADLPIRRRQLWAWMSLAGISTAVCNSRETQTQLASRSGSRVKAFFVPNTAESFSPAQVRACRECWRARLNLSDATVLVLGAGGLNVHKRFDRFLDVIATLPRELPVQAVIAGADRGLLADLEAQMQCLGLENRVRFIGMVPDARELMCAADIFLLSSDREGMPNVVLEAMAAGVPCITTRVNGIGDLVRDGATGFVVGRDINDLAKHVTRLATDADLRRIMGARARAIIEREFQPERVIPQLWALCERPNALRQTDIASG